MGYIVCGKDAFKKIYTTAPAKDGTTLEVGRCNTAEGELLAKGKYLYGIFVQHGDEEDYRVSIVNCFSGGLSFKKTAIFLADNAARAVIKALNPPPLEDDDALILGSPQGG